jgi:hypothetical protein
MTSNAASMPVIGNAWHEYQKAIPRCRKTFESVDENTPFGATSAAFQNAQAGPKDYRPSAYEIYNTWASGILSNLRSEKLTIGARVVDQAGFTAWQDELAESLSEAWANSAHQDHPLAPKQRWKLVNLFIKWLAPKATAPGLRDAILINGHVVLNTPTISKMEELFGTHMPTCPAQPTEAQFIVWYRQCQDLVRAYTSENKFGGSAMLFDIWCRTDFLSAVD